MRRREFASCMRSNPTQLSNKLDHVVQLAFLSSHFHAFLSRMRPAYCYDVSKPEVITSIR
jgi:hypothetical protein